VVGGNSGSPLINKEGELVGVVFDGNFRALGGAFGFDARSSRAIAVSSSAVLESLQNVYDSNSLVMEMAARGGLKR
jgi:S1-C subfamily serine protease